MNLSLQINYNIYEFNALEVKSDIDYFSSKVFKGRLAGTDENNMISQYIKSRFKKYKLQPFKGNYSLSFKTWYPNKIVNEQPYLKVADKVGKTLFEFKYGEDYKEDMLNFRTNSLSFNKDNSPMFYTNTLQVVKDQNPYIFFVPEKDDLSFRSSFVKESSYDLYTMVTKDTLESLRNEIDKGNRIEYYIPYEVKETALENVIGVIKGINPKLPPIILSAHFDHVGYDLNNNIYYGALDNASGISFVLELCKYLQSLGTPTRDIIFIGFNAEEFGCLGSKAFVEKYSAELQGSKVFNFDMIGGSSSIPLCIMGSKLDTSSTPFIASVSAACSAENIQYDNLFEDASDHEYFRKYGIDAVTFCDNDMSKIHTPKDRSEFINPDTIDRCFKVASKEIIEYGYNDNLLLIYYREMIIISTATVMCIIFISAFSRGEN